LRAIAIGAAQLKLHRIRKTAKFQKRRRGVRGDNYDERYSVN